MAAFGLIVTSHILGYVLKRWHQIVTAIIIGFIIGSLGIVWPWKRKLYAESEGHLLLDDMGNKILQNYQRFFPDLSHRETWLAMLFILAGVGLILGIDYYDRKRRSNKKQ